MGVHSFVKSDSAVDRELLHGGPAKLLPSKQIMVIETLKTLILPFAKRCLLFATMDIDTEHPTCYIRTSCQDSRARWLWGL